jgi:hypothetical protein
VAKWYEYFFEKFENRTIDKNVEIVSAILK